MKKHVLLATGLAVLSTSAFATKARMEALGQDTDRGSYYLEDSRSVFLNAATLNNVKNYVVTEWGTANNTNTDSTSAPQAEGGFFREMGSFAYGLYLNNGINSQNDVRRGGNGYANAVAMGDTNFVSQDNRLDLFFAGDMGVKWGARLGYASGKNKTTFEAKNSFLGLGFGMEMGDLAAYANIDLKDESEGATAAGDKWEADTALNIGLSYKVAGMTVFADYDTVGAKYTASGAAAVETSRNTITVGVGKVHEVSSTARINMDLAYVNEKSEDKSTATTEVTDSRLPLTIGFEADATSWLTLRGSVSQAVIINKTETKTTSTTEATNANTTNVAAGATLNFGKLKVDGTIGTTDISRAGTANETGVLSTDNLLTKVAVHYWF